jgi:anaerobic selenocysteine-containing dehydrogenase
VTSGNRPTIEPYNPPLQVVGFVASRRGDDDRGPCVWINADEARKRLIMDGELVWVYGPRRHDLAPVEIDESLPRGAAVVRDILGVAVSEVIRLVKPDLDRPSRGGGTFA